MTSPDRAGSVRVLVRRSEGIHASFEEDALVVEEPLEVRLRERPGEEAVRYFVTMRTPGHDEDLAAGLLFGEGVLHSAEDLLGMSPPDDPGIAPDLVRNVLMVTVAARTQAPTAGRRGASVITSACGVCGETTIERVGQLAAEARRRRGEEDSSGPVVPAAVLVGLTEELRRRQAIFRSTGGLHAAGLFAADGSLVVCREDVGRHNATDKAIGAVPPGKYQLVLRRRVEGESIGPVATGDYRSEIIGPITVRGGEVVTRDIVAPRKVGETKGLPALHKIPAKTGITGTIVDSDGKPVQGARIQAYQHSQMSERPKYVSEGSGVDGTYSLFFPEGGTYYLAARNKFGGPPKIGELYGRYDDGTIVPSAVDVMDGEILKGVNITIHKIW